MAILMKRGGTVYIITNSTNKVLYTRVTSDLSKMLHEHKTKRYPNSFTARYNVSKLVYIRSFRNIEEAIAEEKRIKGGSRKKKIELIDSFNPNWKELGPE